MQLCADNLAWFDALLNYYTALSYHKLYLITKQPAVMNSASLAWREYFDFFPKKLEANPTFVQAREAARQYRDQIQEQ